MGMLNLVELTETTVSCIWLLIWWSAAPCLFWVTLDRWPISTHYNVFYCYDYYGLIILQWEKNDEEIHLTCWTLASSSNPLPAPHLLPFFNVRGAGLRGQRAHLPTPLHDRLTDSWEVLPARRSVHLSVTPYEKANKRLPINPQVSEKPQTHAGTQTCAWIKRTHKDAFVHIHAVMHRWTDAFVSAYLHTRRCFKHLPRQETWSSATRLVVYSDARRLWF